MKLSSTPAFQNVDPNFVSKLETSLNRTNYKDSTEVIGVLMQISTEAKQRNIPFTPEMQTTLLTYFKNQLPRNQRAQFDAILKIFTPKK